MDTGLRRSNYRKYSGQGKHPSGELSIGSPVILTGLLNGDSRALNAL